MSVYTPLKWLNLPFIIYLLLFWCYIWAPKFFWWETKNDKKNLNLKIWKSPKIAFSQNPIFHDQNFVLQKKQICSWKIGFWEKAILGLSNFQIQIFLSFLVSNQNIFFLFANILLSYQKFFGVDSINKKEDIL